MPFLTLLLEHLLCWRETKTLYLQIRGSTAEQSHVHTYQFLSEAGKWLGQPNWKLVPEVSRLSWWSGELEVWSYKMLCLTGQVSETTTLLANTVWTGWASFSASQWTPTHHCPFSLVQGFWGLSNNLLPLPWADPTSDRDLPGSSLIVPFGKPHHNVCSLTESTRLAG